MNQPIRPKTIQAKIDELCEAQILDVLKVAKKAGKVEQLWNHIRPFYENKLK
jgi:hypothetical protein